MPKVKPISARPRRPRAGETPYWVGPLAPLTSQLRADFPGCKWSWVTGGCFALAEGLHAAFGGELWGICSFDSAGGGDYPVEHAVGKIGGKFYDYTGVLTIKLPKGRLLKPKSDPDVFWFEDDFLDDEQMDFLRHVLATGRAPTAALVRGQAGDGEEPLAPDPRP